MSWFWCQAKRYDGFNKRNTPWDTCYWLVCQHAFYLTSYYLILAVNLFVELVDYIFKIPSVNVLLSEHISQDPLEKFFDCTRQRGKSPHRKQFCKGVQALCITNGTYGSVLKGNCRGNNTSVDCELENYSLPKRKRLRFFSSISSKSDDYKSIDQNNAAVSKKI